MGTLKAGIRESSMRNLILLLFICLSSMLACKQRDISAGPDLMDNIGYFKGDESESISLNIKKLNGDFPVWTILLIDTSSQNISSAENELFGNTLFETGNLILIKCNMKTGTNSIRLSKNLKKSYTGNRMNDAIMKSLNEHNYYAAINLLGFIPFKNAKTAGMNLHPWKSWPLEK